MLIIGFGLDKERNLLSQDCLRCFFSLLLFASFIFGLIFLLLETIIMILVG